MPSSSCSISCISPALILSISGFFISVIVSILLCMYSHARTGTARRASAVNTTAHIARLFRLSCFQSFFCFLCSCCSSAGWLICLFPPCKIDSVCFCVKRTFAIHPCCSADRAQLHDLLTVRPASVL